MEPSQVVPNTGEALDGFRDLSRAMLKRPWIDEEEDLLRRQYVSKRHGGNAIHTAAQKLSRKSADVLRRAVILGLTRVRSRYRWTEEEIAVVEQNAHKALETIQRKLKPVSPPRVCRTRAAIAHQITNNRFRRCLDGMDKQTLAMALGVSVEQIEVWRRNGLLKATRLPSLDQHKGAKTVYLQAPWFFPAWQIRAFIFRFPGLIDLRRVNQLWLIELMRQGRYQAQIDRDNGFRL